MALTNQEKHEEAYAAAEEAVRALDPAGLAARAGADWRPEADSYGQGSPGAALSGQLTVTGLGAEAVLAWPSLAVTSDSPLLLSFPWRLIALHYLATATGQPVAEDWVSYRELPDGLFYANTVTREVEEPLAQRFGNDPEGFLAGAARLGGAPVAIADVAALFHPLPRVPVVVALWVEDEEFPAKVKVLYERNGAEYLPLQDLRILADLIGGTLLRGADRSPTDGH